MIHWTAGLRSRFFTVFRTEHVISQHHPARSGMTCGTSRLPIRRNERTHFRTQHWNRHDAVPLPAGIDKTLFRRQRRNPERRTRLLGGPWQRSCRRKTVKAAFMADLLFFQQLANDLNPFLKSRAALIERNAEPPEFMR